MPKSQPAGLPAPFRSPFSQMAKSGGSKKNIYFGVAEKKIFFFALVANNRVWCARPTIFETVISHPFFFQTFWGGPGTLARRARKSPEYEITRKKSRRSFFFARVFFKIPMGLGGTAA